MIHKLGVLSTYYSIPQKPWQTLAASSIKKGVGIAELTRAINSKSPVETLAKFGCWVPSLIFLTRNTNFGDLVVVSVYRALARFCGFVPKHRRLTWLGCWGYRVGCISRWSISNWGRIGISTSCNSVTTASETSEPRRTNWVQHTRVIPFNIPIGTLAFIVFVVVNLCKFVTGV